MHIRVEKASHTGRDHVELIISAGSSLVESMQQALAAGEKVSLRFAAARFGNEPFLVIGVRKAGRGFDLILPKTMWECFADEVNQLVLVCEENGIRVSTILDWDVEAFHEFLDQCQQRYEDDPGLEVIGQVVTFFG